MNAQVYDSPWQIIVVGAGPTGLSAANLLGQYGLSVLVLEKAVTPIDHPRAVALDAEALRTFQAMGWVGEISRELVVNPPVLYQSPGVGVLARLEGGFHPQGHPAMGLFLQPRLEAHLTEGLKRFGNVRLLRGCELIALRHCDDIVRVTYQCSGGSTVTADASFVLGCDGACSRVRELLRIEFEGRSCRERWLVIDVEKDPLGSPHFQFRCDPARPSVTCPLPDGHRRFEFLLKPDEAAEIMLRQATIDELLRGWIGEQLVRIIRSAVYKPQTRIASCFGRGHVFLLGDAAHLMPPYAGQGMMSGLRDASNLAWKVAMVLRHQAHSHILRSYECERRPHIRRMVTVSRLSGAVLTPTSRPAALARDLILRAPGARRLVHWMAPQSFIGLKDAIAVRGIGCASRHVGRPLVQPWVQLASGRTVLLDDILGPGFSVIGIGVAPPCFMSPQSAGFWVGLDARIVRVIDSFAAFTSSCQHPSTATLEVRDVAGELRYLSNRIVVVRPDRYVAGVARPAAFDRLSFRIRALLRKP